MSEITETTKNEREIIMILRELKPFECINLQKDQLGRPDYYIITRTQKIILPKKVGGEWNENMANIQ